MLDELCEDRLPEIHSSCPQLRGKSLAGRFGIWFPTENFNREIDNHPHDPDPAWVMQPADILPGQQ